MPDTAPDPAGPLGVPAMVIAVLMCGAAIAAAGEIGGWAADYGGLLVYVAVALYLALALRLFWWGAAVRRSWRGRAAPVDGDVRDRPVDPSG